MTQGDVTFSHQMRSQAKAAWDAAIGHRFFREVADDTMDDRLFARYLKIEYGFVDCAAAALGYAVAKAPSLRERRRLAFGLYGLVTDQEQFFVSAFDRMGVPQEERAGLAPRGLSAPLHDLFLSVANSRATKRFSLLCLQRSGCT
jgi:thiaminase/transcriptional activator TenA